MEESLSYSTAAVVTISGHQVIYLHQGELPKVGGDKFPTKSSGNTWIVSHVSKEQGSVE